MLDHVLVFLLLKQIRILHMHTHMHACTHVHTHTHTHTLNSWCYSRDGSSGNSCIKSNHVKTS